MSAEQNTKAENSVQSKSTGVGRGSSRKAEQRNLWLSRGSFFLSALALVSVGYRSVARHVSDSPVPASQAAAVAPPLSNPAMAGLDTPEPAPDGVLEAQEPVGFVPRVHNELKKGLAALKIKRLVVTSAVEDREPVAVTDVVDAQTPVIAFLEVASGAAEDQQVVVTFEHEAGQQVGLVNLSVPGNKPRWRTWGRTYNINRDGRWTAVVRDSRGEELGRTEFTVRRQS